MRRATGTALAGLLTGAVIGMPGCAGWPFVQSAACPGWAVVDSPAQARNHADAVVIGHVARRDGTGSFLGAEVHAWTVSVEHWTKGSGGDRIRVASTPDGCPGQEPYLEGDPFEAAVENEESVIFLTRDDDAWRSLSPLQGVIPATPSGGIPDAWPPGMMGSPPATTPAER